jgi:hypothetical protein
MDARVGFINLCWEEVMLLTDRVAHGDSMEGAVDPRALLLKLGSAYVELIQEDGGRSGEVTIGLTEPEAWLLRGKVSSADKLATRPRLGVQLLRKLYRVLLDFNTTMDLPDGAVVEEPDKRQVADAITRWRRSLDGSTGSDHTRDQTSDGAAA